MNRLSKATTEQIIEAYKRDGSVWKAAKSLGMCGQSVYERLRKVGFKLNEQNLCTQDELDELKYIYLKGFKRGDGKIVEFCKKFHRTRQYVSRKARELGLTNKNRMVSDTIKKSCSNQRKIWIKENSHPRGMLGKKHSIEMRERMSKICRDRWVRLSDEERHNFIVDCMKRRLAKNGTLVQNNNRSCWKSGIRIIGGKSHFYRSSWEANYARYLQFLMEQGKIVSWVAEPKTFIFENEETSYLPDFYVVYPDGHSEFHEVKGWYDERSRKKISLMHYYLPNISISIIFKKEYKQIERKFSNVISDWEYKNQSTPTTTPPSETNPLNDLKTTTPNGNSQEADNCTKTTQELLNTTGNSTTKGTL